MRYGPEYAPRQDQRLVTKTSGLNTPQIGYWQKQGLQLPDLLKMLKRTSNQGLTSTLFGLAMTGTTMKADNFALIGIA